MQNQNMQESVSLIMPIYDYNIARTAVRLYVNKDTVNLIMCYHSIVIFHGSSTNAYISLNNPANQDVISCHG